MARLTTLAHDAPTRVGQGSPNNNNINNETLPLFNPPNTTYAQTFTATSIQNNYANNEPAPKAEVKKEPSCKEEPTDESSFNFSDYPPYEEDDDDEDQQYEQRYNYQYRGAAPPPNTGIRDGIFLAIFEFCFVMFLLYESFYRATSSRAAAANAPESGYRRRR